jgi:hypothetical protein
MDNKHVNYLRFFLINAMILVALSQSVFPDKNPLYKVSLQKGISFLEQGSPDSAINHFVEAFSSGLSKDSLFYFWSEALLQKNVLDSALAANYMVKENHEGFFKLQILKQRKLIYDRLGWQKEASALLDTIHSLPEYRRLKMFPELEINTYLGYGRRSLVSGYCEPWRIGNGSTIQQYENDWMGGMDIRSKWQTNHKGKIFSTGIAGSINRFSDKLALNNESADSNDIDGSVFGTITGRNLTSTGNISVNRRFDDSLFLGGSIEGGGIIGSSKFTPLLWSGASIYATTNLKFSNARSWFFFSAQQRHNSFLKIDYQVFLNLYVNRKYEFSQTKEILVLYADDARLQYPVFYTDQTYSTMIDTSYFRIISGQLTKDIQGSGTDSIIVSKLIVPNSNLSFAPRISISLGFKLPVQIGATWRLNYYPELYQWDVFSNDAGYLIHSRADGKYYKLPQKWTVNKGSNGGIAISPGIEPGNFQHVSMKRIDNTISVDLSSRLFENKSINGSMRSSISKTWSTLSGKAPLNIESWNFSTYIELKFQTQNVNDKI